MSQGLFTAVGGIKTCQTKIDVISDNIANINTVGFKGSVVTFQNVFAKTLSSGSAPTGNTGGTNPMQVGLGVSVGEVSRNFGAGSIQSTGRSTDLNIQGEGFFTLQNPAGGVYLSRAGNFSLDSQGNLINASGLKILGTGIVEGGSGSTSTIKIPTALNFTTKDVNMGTKLSDVTTSTNTAGTDGTFSITLDDGSNTKFSFSTIDPATNKSKTIQQISDDINASISGLTLSVIPSTADATKYVIKTDNASGKQIIFDTGSSNIGSMLNVTTLADGSNQEGLALKDASTITIDPADGSANTATYTSLSIGATGAIEATYSNGAKITVSGSPSLAVTYKTPSGTILDSANTTINNSAVTPKDLQLQMCKVVNPAGLISEGGNMFTTGANSGEPTYGTAGAAGLGSLNSGQLETSNIDLPSEFAELIVAQRGIDANSRTFQAQNDILTKIVQLGR